jgi:hypothetical protein
LRASSVFALLDFSPSLSRAHTQFAFLGAISLLFSMAVVARPSMPAAMQSCGISKFQLQKQQQEQLGSLRMVQLLPMTSVRRCGSKKEERSQAGWRDSRQRMKMYISAAVSVNSGVLKGQAQNQNSAIISKEDAKTISSADNDGAISTESTVTIIVVGASGDLAKKKIFPALFALYYEGCLPKVHKISQAFLN